MCARGGEEVSQRDVGVNFFLMKEEQSEKTKYKACSFFRRCYGESYHKSGRNCDMRGG